jgi:hypothetical protein
MGSFAIGDRMTAEHLLGLSDRLTQRRTRSANPNRIDVDDLVEAAKAGPGQWRTRASCPLTTKRAELQNRFGLAVARICAGFA